MIFPLEQRYDAENRDSMGRSEALSKRARVSSSSPEGLPSDETSTHGARDLVVQDPDLAEGKIESKVEETADSLVVEQPFLPPGVDPDKTPNGHEVRRRKHRYEVVMRPPAIDPDLWNDRSSIKIRIWWLVNYRKQLGLRVGDPQ